jgi:hypothetical protein
MNLRMGLLPLKGAATSAVMVAPRTKRAGSVGVKVMVVEEIERELRTF